MTSEQDVPGHSWHSLPSPHDLKFPNANISTAAFSTLSLTSCVDDDGQPVPAATLLTDLLLPCPSKDGLRPRGTASQDKPFLKTKTNPV